jgi:hypothetical protein
VLASITAAAHAAVPEAIADAVEQGFTWQQVAHCAGISVRAGRRRHKWAQPRKPSSLTRQRRAAARRSNPPSLPGAAG